jgi:hypothetical protein
MTLMRREQILIVEDDVESCEVMGTVRGGPPEPAEACLSAVVSYDGQQLITPNGLCRAAPLMSSTVECVPRV